MIELDSKKNVKEKWDNKHAQYHDFPENKLEPVQVSKNDFLANKLEPEQVPWNDFLENKLDLVQVAKIS